MQKAWSAFSSEHPQFSQFIQYICTHPIAEGDVIAVSVDRGGNRGKVSSNLRVSEKDLELISLLQSLGKK